MEIVCINKFGDLELGDTRIVPDGSAFSELYFREVVPEPVPKELPKVKDARLGKDMAKNKEEG